MQTLNTLGIASWAVIVGFRIKEMLEDDIPPGAELSVESIIHSERVSDMFHQRQLSDEIRRLIHAILMATAELYPELLTIVDTGKGPLFIRSL